MFVGPMDDLRTTARTAREGLARGLACLQDPSLPPQLMDAAAPIARAMGALMQAERSDGRASSVRPQAEVALAGAREALSFLQGMNLNHPAVEQAMGAVASSLGAVHGLTRAQSAPPPAPQPGYGYAQPPQPAYQAPQAYQPPPQQAYQAPPPQAYAPPQPPYQPPPQPAYQPPPQQAYQPPPQQQTAYQPPQPAYQPPQPAYQPPPPPAFQQPPAPQIAGAPPPPSFQPGPPASIPQMAPNANSLPPPAGTIEAELGAHSPSNFYKTLNGNDIVEHGGLFVATYNVPQLNKQLHLRVHLPGGYQFDCSAIVRWTRESRDNPDAPPGFGAQMVGITAEQRGLIQRYVRNREPLFYDDF
jgi:hypothetical protein